MKARFGGKKESKKMQKTILKQQYENFAASRSEGLDKTYDRDMLLPQLMLMMSCFPSLLINLIVHNWYQSLVALDLGSTRANSVKMKNIAASILSTTKIVTYCAAVYKKGLWFVFGGDAVGYGCDLIEYFIIMVVIVLLSLVSTASYVLVLHVFTLYCQRKLALFEFKDEFLCY
ncbi:hypothetical protein Tco_1119815 [Tanacetum coccineum]